MTVKDKEQAEGQEVPSTEIERLKAENASLREELEEARNEACVRCGFPTHDIISAAVTENASLLESLRAATDLKERAEALREADLRHWAGILKAAEQRAEAAEKRSADLKGALRAARLGVENVAAKGRLCAIHFGASVHRLAWFNNEVQHEEKIALATIDAALHDEERPRED